MKIVKDKKVYDLDYGKYEIVTMLPSGWERNEVGNFADTKRELRRDRESGSFYVCSQAGGCSRSQYNIAPVTADEAAKLAEDFVEYNDYIKFFSDPEGTDKGLARERDAALEKAKDAEKAKDYWYGQYEERGRRIRELEAELKAAQGRRIRELEAELKAAQGRLDEPKGGE